MSDWSSLPGGSRIKLKIIFLGDQSVGKSSIIDKYIKEQFDDQLNPTVGIDFHIKNVSYGGNNYRLQLWDTAGQQRFKSLIPSYLKDANCALLVFDVTKKATFQNLQIWEKMFEEYRKIDAVKIVVGNKIDLKTQKVISESQGKKLAAKFNAKYIEMSAKTNQNLNQLFDLTIGTIETQVEKRQTIPIPEEDQEKNKNDLSVARNVSLKANHKNENGKPQEGISKKKEKDSCC